LYGKDKAHTAEEQKAAIDSYEAEMGARGRPAVLASRRAGLGSHEQGRINERSPLMSRRAIKLEELQDLE
jgi:hypothetical protein